LNNELRKINKNFVHNTKSYLCVPLGHGVNGNRFAGLLGNHSSLKNGKIPANVMQLSAQGTRIICLTPQENALMEHAGSHRFYGDIEHDKQGRHQSLDTRNFSVFTFFFDFKLVQAMN